MKLKECKSKEEKLQELKARAKAKGDNIKGFHNLFLAIYEKFDFNDREALRRTSEAINHGISYFTLRDETLKEKIKILKYKKYLIESLIPLIGKELNKVNNFDNLLFYVHTGDFMEMSKDVLSFICKSETEEQKANVGNAEIKSDKPKTESKRSEAQKMSDIKYHSSAKGKATNKKYRESAKGKATITNYLQSEAGRKARAKANKNYSESDRGKEILRKAYNKYKNSEKGKEARRRAIKAYRERQKANKENI